MVGGLIKGIFHYLLQRIHCIPDVKAQLEELERRYNLGRSAGRATALSTEMAFTIQLVDGKIMVSSITTSPERNWVNVPFPRGTLAWIHSHPNGRFLSPQDLKIANDKNVLTYILGPGGLTFYDPNEPEKLKRHANKCN